MKNQKFHPGSIETESAFQQRFPGVPYTNLYWRGTAQTLLHIEVDW